VTLKKYQELNKELPEVIIMYRDGVGDGQIRYVYYDIPSVERRQNAETPNYDISSV
jgi:hypothetical protein